MAKPSVPAPQTSSSDFLPGKPSLDSLSTGASGNTSQPTATPGKASTPPANASAHIIDLKNSPESPADSPLFEGLDDEPATPVPTPTPAPPAPPKPEEPVKVAVGSSEPAPATPAPQSSAAQPSPSASLPEKKDVNELNLTSNQDSASHSKPAKKGGKLKWVIIIVCIMVVLAIVAGAVILILSSTTV